MSIEQLQSLGVEYRLVGYGEQEGRVSQIRLPLTPEQWVDLCDREGDLLPMCCASISEIRDICLETLRDRGWIKVEDLAAMAALMHSHHDDLFVRGTGSVWDKIQAAFDALSDCGEQAEAHQTMKAQNPTDIRDAIHMLSEQSTRYWMTDMFTRPDKYPAEQYPHMSAEERASKAEASVYHHKKNRALSLLKLAPPLHTVYHRLTELDLGPVEGFTAVLTVAPRWVDGPDRKRVLEPNIRTDEFGHGIIMTADGPAIFEHQADLKEAISIWKRRNPRIREQIAIRRVRVSATGGIQLLEEVL